MGSAAEDRKNLIALGAKLDEVGPFDESLIGPFDESLMSNEGQVSKLAEKLANSRQQIAALSKERFALQDALDEATEKLRGTRWGSPNPIW